MLESLFVNIVSGVAVALFLEWWRSRNAGAARTYAESAARTAEPGALAAPGAGAAPLVSAGFSLIRVVVALGLGFILAALFAVILERQGHPEIKFGEPLMVMLFAGCTALAWMALSLFRSRRA